MAEPAREASGAGEVRLHREGPVAVLTLDHQRKLNALTWSMYDQLEQHARTLAADTSVRAVVLTAAGERAFAAGTDIAQFTDFDAERGVAYEHRVGEVLQTLAGVPVPVVAAVPGLAVGAGLVLVAACDLVVAAEDVRFGAPVAQTLGNCIDAGAVRLVRDRVGRAWTDRMLLGTDLVTAAELAGTGFVTRLLPAGTDPRPVALELAGRVAGAAPLTVRALKEVGRRLDADPAADVDDLLARCYGSHDFAEGVAAFTARRAPVWEGR
ncbi:enoyl-CoA hydratase-related protein [Desertihabitans brevis]|uniref:enoyl-CoA hydratase-related protein n=1 Tax=Desertihabitans brevis TaxID=2268447 RepID=UPI0013146492|nr:enoyl-CoA hydratase-related protein [Desertihabitans brevis]